MNRLTIRRFVPADLEALYGLLSDADVMRYLEPPYTREAAADFLQRFGLSDAPLVYAVDDAAGAFVGYVIFHPYDDSSWEIGWVLCKAVWGKGYASQLTQRLITYATGKTKALVIECAPQQLATRQIALRHGFAFLERRDGLDVYRLLLPQNP